MARVSDSAARSTGKTGRPLRRDAQENRDRILSAARQAYAADGIDVSMAEIARRAGVGIATLLRRFPQREDLIAAVFGETMRIYAQSVRDALAMPDPWEGFVEYVTSLCAMQAENRGFGELLIMALPTAKELEADRAAAYQGFTELIARAKEAGRLRPDFSPEDLVLLLMANAGVVAATAQELPDAWRRLVAFMLQAFTVHDTKGMPAPPDRGALYRAMVRLNRRPADGS
jgi:AcrR family transcriptional regulator